MLKRAGDIAQITTAISNKSRSKTLASSPHFRMLNVHLPFPGSFERSFTETKPPRFLVRRSRTGVHSMLQATRAAIHSWRSKKHD